MLIELIDRCLLLVNGGLSLLYLHRFLNDKVNQTVSSLMAGALLVYS
jgi:hypothetical protein